MSLNDYFGDEINICSESSGVSSNLPDFIEAFLGTGASLLFGMATTRLYSTLKEFYYSCKEFVSHSAQRKVAFKGAIKEAIFDDSLSGFFSSFAPKLLFDLTKYVKWFIWDNNLSDVQKFIKEISKHSDNYFYLVQEPSSCAEKDNVAFRIESDGEVNLVCESENYTPYRNYLGFTVDVSLIAAPLIKTISSCYSAYKTGHVTKKAACMGSLLVAVPTVLEHLLTEFMTGDNDKSLSQSWANEYIAQHAENENLYLAQKPAECAKGDKVVDQPLWYVGGDWSVCEEVAG